MKKLISPLLFLVLTSCDKQPKPDFQNYHNIGSFTNRASGENAALRKVIEIDNVQKVESYLYSFGPRNAVHYNNTNQHLFFEQDPYSGYSCEWDSISLDQIKKVVLQNGDLRDITKLRKPIFGDLNDKGFLKY